MVPLVLPQGCLKSCKTISILQGVIKPDTNNGDITWFNVQWLFNIQRGLNKCVSSSIKMHVQFNVHSMQSPEIVFGKKGIS